MLAFTSQKKVPWKQARRHQQRSSQDRARGPVLDMVALPRPPRYENNLAAQGQTTGLPIAGATSFHGPWVPETSSVTSPKSSVTSSVTFPKEERQHTLYLTHFFLWEFSLEPPLPHHSLGGKETPSSWAGCGDGASREFCDPSATRLARSTWDSTSGRDQPLS